MNIIQKLLAFLFGCQYVILVMYDRAMPVKRAYELGGKMYANPYLSKTKTELLPGGKVFGMSFVHGWRPVTKGMFALYEKKDTEE